MSSTAGERFTPGPWFAADDGTIWHEAPVDQICCGRSLPVWNRAGTEFVGEECCGMPNVSGGQEAIGQSSGANARLMSAAPDLLDALKTIMGHDDKITVGIGGNPIYVGEVMAKAYAAIAKAEGRSPAVLPDHLDDSQTPMEK